MPFEKLWGGERRPPPDLPPEPGPGERTLADDIFGIPEEFDDDAILSETPVEEGDLSAEEGLEPSPIEEGVLTESEPIEEHGTHLPDPGPLAVEPPHPEIVHEIPVQEVAVAKTEKSSTAPRRESIGEMQRRLAAELEHMVEEAQAEAITRAVGPLNETIKNLEKLRDNLNDQLIAEREKTRNLEERLMRVIAAAQG